MRTGLLRTTTFRLALAYLALFGGSVIILFGFIYWATAGYMARQMDETIEAEITGLAEQYRQTGIQGLANVIHQRIERDPAGSEVYLLTDPNFLPIAGNLDRWPDAQESIDGWMEFELHDRATRPGETYLAHARHFRLAGGFHLLVGRDARALQQVQRVMLRAFGWGLAITVALGLVGGLLMSRGALRRIEAINRTSREIMAGDLARRVPTQGSGDDFDQLAQNLNAMLDRIEKLMDSIRHVSEGVAHDLRSPLTRLRHRLETARMATEEPEEQRRLVDASIAEADTLLATFNALLRIAEAESGRARAGFAAVNLAQVAQDAIELYEPVAQERRQTLVASIQPVTIVGDRHLLSQALANLLDNAIKCAPEGGRIDVELTSGPDGSVLSVADNGPGVPAQYRDKVLERFFRLDASRSTPGSGLGLSLVAAVAQLHDARLALTDNRPGLRVTITFPPPSRA
ncbi:MAG TPA: HAMP domain-containing sensor histidine kinase [Alphaproteobacteria bacterium]